MQATNPFRSYTTARGFSHKLFLAFVHVLRLVLSVERLTVIVNRFKWVYTPNDAR